MSDKDFVRPNLVNTDGMRNVPLEEALKHDEALGKLVLGDKWETLNYWQKMCEVAYIKSSLSRDDLFGGLF